MSDYRHSYVRWEGREYKVTWHPISKEVYVYWGTDRYAGKAYHMQEAMDIALGWLNSHARADSGGSGPLIPPGSGPAFR